MISTEIDFHAPTDLAGALQLLAEHGDDITVLSGGMSLLPMMNLGLAAPERMLSLRQVDGLTAIVDEGDAVLIGGMATHRDVATHEVVRAAAPAVATAASLIGDVQVRNRGTIGGSVSHADPAADYVPSVCAHGGEVILSSARGERSVPAAEFFLDVMFTARQPDEIVTAVRVPRLPAGAVAEYIRFARVEGSFAIVNAAVVLAPSGSRIALGGVGGSPVILDIDEHGASGWGEEAAEAVGDAAFEACVDVQGDIMSDAVYRREMARVHAKRVVSRAAARLNSGTSQGATS